MAEKYNTQEPKSLDSMEGNEFRQEDDSNENLLEFQDEIFGPDPEYLSNGLDVWLNVCDTQAQEGIDGLKKFQRFDLFYGGMSTYFHNQPKDIGAVSYYLQGLGKLSVGEELPQKRKINEGGREVIAEFEELFTRASDNDLKKAGASFCGGRILDKNLQTIAKMGFDSSVNSAVFLGWRRKDYDLHRKKFDSKEFKLFLDAINSARLLYDFNDNHRDESIEGTMSEKDIMERERLDQIAQSTRVNWWVYYVSLFETS